MAHISKLVCEGYAQAKKFDDNELGDPVFRDHDELGVHVDDERRLSVLVVDKRLLLVEPVDEVHVFLYECAPEVFQLEISRSEFGHLLRHEVVDLHSVHALLESDNIFEQDRVDIHHDHIGVAVVLKYINAFDV